MKLNFDSDKKSNFFNLLFINPDLKFKIDYSFFSLILIKKIDIFIVCLFKNDRYKDFIIYRYILYISRTINIQIVQCSDRDIYNKLSLDELFNFFHTKKKNGNQKIM